MGIGLVGKEGKQASLAADFSITQFSHTGRLLLVHGRNSYKRSASLSQFVIHRCQEAAGAGEGGRSRCQEAGAGVRRLEDGGVTPSSPGAS